MAQKFCTYCGAKLKPELKFCPQCGKPIRQLSIDRHFSSGNTQEEPEYSELKVVPGKTFRVFDIVSASLPIVFWFVNFFLTSFYDPEGIGDNLFDKFGGEHGGICITYFIITLIHLFLIIMYLLLVIKKKTKGLKIIVESFSILFAISLMLFGIFDYYHFYYSIIFEPVIAGLFVVCLLVSIFSKQTKPKIKVELDD